MRRLLRQGGSTFAVVSTLWSGGVHAQAAIDPNVAPRAAALERSGERQMAIDLLGRYLATAPDDGRAWFQLGRFYLLDARDWHLQGHRGDPDGLLYLDFAATAFDQAVRLAVDSGVVYRGLAELERSVVLVEDSGWSIGGASRPPADAPEMPGFIVELGANLLSSCPAGGVLLVGTDLEALSVWYDNRDLRAREILPIRPDRYATDSVYRRRMAEAMAIDPDLPVRNALADVAARRPLCLTPTADSAAAPAIVWTPFRLTRVSRTVDPGPDALSLTELLEATRQGGSVWLEDVRGVYDSAARFNALLCSSLLLVSGDAPPPACRP
ncbi:MAG TPA: tetratricopeptide repeat protein [Gemmatimonadales bacterium]|jgi:tetratricopeptide (TPR) repeat protein|nr:tetratricopeptide repeat protein [Gemmatimonadales bacterium]